MCGWRRLFMRGKQKDEEKEEEDVKLSDSPGATECAFSMCSIKREKTDEYFFMSFFCLLATFIPPKKLGDFSDEGSELRL